jgi:hypothetical protein
MRIAAAMDDLDRRRRGVAHARHARELPGIGGEQSAEAAELLEQCLGK